MKNILEILNVKLGEYESRNNLLYKALKELSEKTKMNVEINPNTGEIKIKERKIKDKIKDKN